MSISILSEPSEKTRILGGALVLGFSLPLVFYVTLFPFDFVAYGPTSWRAVLAGFDLSFLRRYVIVDFPGNILLFLPLGFGLGLLLLDSGLKKTRATGIVLMVSFGLSVTVEMLQFLLPGRFSTLVDVVANVTGAMLGLFLAHKWGTNILHIVSTGAQGLADRLSTTRLALLTAGYFILMLSGSLILQAGARLDNWNPSFNLILGNEGTGDRPWQGHISNVYMFDRALTAEEVVETLKTSAPSTTQNGLAAFYPVTGIDGFVDQTGHSPDLLWRGGEPVIAGDQRSLGLSADHWLETASPLTAFSESVAQSSEFTLGATVATSDSTQSGPARIVSLSGDPYDRNLTVGQEQGDLVVRLRTRFTGDNGRKPELVVSGVFADNRPHHLILVYDGSAACVYIDVSSSDHCFAFTPATMLTWMLPPTATEQIYVSSMDIMPIYTLLYGALMLVLPVSVFTLFFLKRRATGSGRTVPGQTAD